MKRDESTGSPDNSSSMNDPLSRWFQTLRLWPFVLAMLAASYVIVLPLYAVAVFFPALELGSGSIAIRDADFVGKLFLGSVVVPLLETAFFQWAPIRLLRLFGQVPWPVCVLVSAAAFAASHTFSVGYVVFSFLVGLVLAYCYVLCLAMQRRAFWVTCTVHALRNLVATVVVTFGVSAA